jgi:uncharacterized YceG family protein
VVERPPVNPPRPRRPKRQPPTVRRLAFRRALAVVSVLVLLGFLGWGAFALVGSGSGSGSGTKNTLPPPPRPFKIVFPEGFTRHDMAQRITAVDKIAMRERGVRPRLSRAAYLAATRVRRRVPHFGARQYTLEGFLFPATYEFTAQTTSRQLAKAQLSAFERNWLQVDLGYARSKNLTPYDVLIIASLVEKEALAPEERAKIARVIYNRLHARMNLGIDASTRYGLGIPGTKSLTASELASNNPYNTRNPSIIGLPPTPIANPGLASIQAAAHPARGDWLYFVRKPDKVHHFFTASFSAFQNYANAHGY